MSISSVASLTNLYQSSYPGSSAAAGNSATASGAAGSTGLDTVELSSAGKSAGGSAGTAACPKGNKTCIGCGACKQSAGSGLPGTSAVNSLSTINSQDNVSTDANTLQAINAYENQIKYL